MTDGAQNSIVDFFKKNFPCSAFHCSDLLFRIKDITQMLKECEALADQPKVLIVDVSGCTSK